MKCGKEVVLSGYRVRYVDLREPKPRAVRGENVYVMDKDALTALSLLSLDAADFVEAKYARGGYHVTSVERLEAEAYVLHRPLPTVGDRRTQRNQRGKRGFHPVSEQTVAVPVAIDADFCFINTGDSMINARIFDGDIVYIHQQDTAESGDIIVFLYQGEARIGVFSSGPTHIAFTPANPQYPSLVFFDEEMEEVEIIGKAVAFLASIQSQKETRGKPPQTES